MNKGLPYYEFDWGTEDPRRVVNQNLKLNLPSKISKFWISKIIQEYLAGKFKTETQKIVEVIIFTYISKEAVFFFLNSVTGICKAIQQTFFLDQCNILCAKNR